MHKVQAILNSIYQKLLLLVEDKTIKEVLKNSIQEPRNYPCVIMKMGDENVITKLMSNFNDIELRISFDVVVKSTDKDIDKSILLVCSELQKKIVEDPTQGLDFVIDTTYEGRDSGDYQGEAEHYYASASLNYYFKYRTDIKDPNV